MKKLILLGGLALAALLVAAVVFQGVDALARPSALDYARQQAELDRLAREAARAEALQPVDTFVAAAWRLLPLGLALGASAYLGALGVAQLARFRHERQPDGRGLLPVPAHQLGDVGTRALSAYHGARQLEAQRQPVPHSLTYSPHSNYRADGATGSGAALVAPEQPAAALPGLIDLAALGHRPTADLILLGLAEGGERITVPARGLCHVALVGATGGGKSNLMRLLLPQLQAIGARVVLADPHHAPLDLESGDDWRPIVSRLHLPPAVAPREIGDLLGFLVEELERRLELRRAGQKWGPALFLALDELPVIADTVPGSVDQLGRLLREGRKVGLYSVGASQSMLVKVVGGDSSAREAYRTAFYVGGDLKSAAALLDVPQREIAEGAVGGGVAYLRSAATAPARLVRVPLASNAAVRGLLGDGADNLVDFGPASSPTSGRAARSEGPSGREAGASGVPTPSARDARILALVRQQKGVSEIIGEVWGVKGGSKYGEYSAEVMRVIATALDATAH